MREAWQLEVSRSSKVQPLVTVLVGEVSAVSVQLEVVPPLELLLEVLPLPLLEDVLDVPLLPDVVVDELVPLDDELEVVELEPHAIVVERSAASRAGRTRFMSASVASDV